MADFPGAIFSTTTKVAGDRIQPAHINNLQDEIIAIETALLSTGIAFKTVMAVRATLSSAVGQVISSAVGVFVGVGFVSADDFDSASMHDPSTNSSMVRVPVAGYYQVNANCRWAATSTDGYRQLRLNMRTPAHGYGQLAMVQMGPGDALGTGSPSQSVSDVIYVPSTSHYLNVDVAQASGTNVTLETCHLSAVFVGI